MIVTLRRIFNDDDPLVLDGTYDVYGYTPHERRRKERQMAKKAKTEKKRGRQAKPARAPITGARARKAGAKVTAPRRGRPRNQALPGMEDHGIRELDDCGAEYREIVEERMGLTQREHELKVTVKRLMHKYDKVIYRHDGIEIKLLPGEEDVKVRKLKDTTETEIEPSDAGAVDEQPDALETEDDDHPLDGPSEPTDGLH